jgi:hypothetical protein
MYVYECSGGNALSSLVKQARSPPDVTNTCVQASRQTML